MKDWPELHLLRSAGEALEVTQAAHDAGDLTVGPTHRVELGGQLIGTLGIGPIRIMRAWLRRDVKPATSVRTLRQAELLMREQGWPHGWLMLNPESPFTPEVMGRLGWTEAGRFTLYRRPL